MGQKRAYQRTERVSQQVHEVLASALLFDASDPRLKSVQLTGVDVSGDLRHATAFWILVETDADEEVEAAAEALESCSGFLRKLLGDRTRMKFVPELHFEYDESVGRGRRIEALLADVLTEEE